MDRFYAWLNNKNAGSTFIYYCGDLSADRSSFGGSDTKTPQQMEAGLIARAAWNAYEKGLVTLMRKRVGYIGTSRFEYIAVRRQSGARRVGATERCLEAAA